MARCALFIIFIIALISVIHGQYQYPPRVTGYAYSIDFTGNLTSVGSGFDDFHYSFHYTVANNTLYAAIVCQVQYLKADYCAFAFSPSGDMVGSDAVMVWVDGNGTANAMQYALGGQATPAASCATSPNRVCPHSLLPGCTNNARVRCGYRSENFTVVHFTRPIAAQDTCDKTITLGSPTNVIFAIGNVGTQAWPLNPLFHHHFLGRRPLAITLRTSTNPPSSLTCPSSVVLTTTSSTTTTTTSTTKAPTTSTTGTSTSTTKAVTTTTTTTTTNKASTTTTTTTTNKASTSATTTTTTTNKASTTASTSSDSTTSVPTAVPTDEPDNSTSTTALPDSSAAIYFNNIIFTVAIICVCVAIMYL